MAKELFLEIGTEEIPAGFLPKAMADMEASDPQGAGERPHRLRRGANPGHAAPSGAAGQAMCRRSSRRSESTAMGPAKNVAFDADGKPTKAAEGFARGQGVDVAAADAR